MFVRRFLFLLLLGVLTGSLDMNACSMVYYVANNEDYWYDAAITPKQEIPEGFTDPKRNVEEAIHYLIATNFLLSETARGDIECPRYRSIEERVKQLRAKSGKSRSNSVIRT